MKTAWKRQITLKKGQNLDIWKNRNDTVGKMEHKQSKLHIQILSRTARVIQISIESKAIDSCIDQWLTTVTLSNREPSRGETSTEEIRERETTENLQLQSLENPYWGHHHCNTEEAADLSLMHEHQQNSEIIDSRRWMRGRASRFLTQGNEKFHFSLFFCFFIF